MIPRLGLLAALLAYPFSSAQAQTTWQPKTSNATASFGAIHFVDPNNVWTVGGLATVRNSTDGGETWNTKGLAVDPQGCCNSIRFVDNSTGWIGGLRAVLRTTDGGANWGGVVSNVTETYRQRLFPVSQTVAWAVGGTSFSGQVLIGHFRYTFAQDNSFTVDTWFTVATVNDLLNDIFLVDPDNGWSIGTGGRITRITNGTAGTPTFTPQTSPTTAVLTDIQMRSLTLGWIVGANGTILKTTDGTNWNPMTSPTPNRLQSVHFVSDQLGWIVGEAGTILVSSDGGATWQTENSGVTTRLRGVFLNGAGYAVGDAGTILERQSDPGPVTSIAPSSGPAAGGQSVTITGTNLSGATSVTFGGTAGAITANSATSITVTTAAHAAGAVDVVVTTAGGSSTATNGYTYEAAPTIGSITPNEGPTAGGQSVTVNGTNLSGATVTIGGNVATVTGTTATTATFATPAHAAGAVDVTVTTPGGSATATNGYNYVASGSIGSITPTSGPAAGGQSVALTGTDLGGATSVTFGGTAGAITANSATSITVTTPAHAAGAVDVVVTTAGGSSTATNAYTYEAVVVKGDANGDGVVTTSDIFYLINNLFAGGPGPIGSGDANGDGVVTTSDIFYLINHLFAGGPAPV